MGGKLFPCLEPAAATFQQDQKRGFFSVLRWYINVKGSEPSVLEHTWPDGDVSISRGGQGRSRSTVQDNWPEYKCTQ